MIPWKPLPGCLHTALEARNGREWQCGNCKALLVERAPNTADFYYDKDNWEYTWEESDFFDMLTDGDYNKRVLRVGRLQKLSDQWAARVPLGEPYEEGDYEEYEWTLFDTEAEARAAAKEAL